MQIKVSNGGINRFEVLDKKDVLKKLIYRQNEFIHRDRQLFQRIGDDIAVTARSTAKLFVYDNKAFKAAALNHHTYELLYFLLNQCTYMHLDPRSEARKSFNEHYN